MRKESPVASGRRREIFPLPDSSCFAYDGSPWIWGGINVTNFEGPPQTQTNSKEPLSSFSLCCRGRARC